MRASRARVIALAFVTVAGLAGPRPAPAAPPSAPGAPRPVREDDLLRFEWVADPRIAPDGSRVAFTRVTVDTAADDYRTSLWIIDADGAGPAMPRALTAGPRDSQPRWSPDGRAIAFVRGTEGKPGQLFVLSMEGGEAVQLTRLAGGAASPTWSPDSRNIAFTSGTNPALDADTARAKPKHEPGRIVTRPVFRLNGAGFLDPGHWDHLWVVPAAGGAPRQLTAGRFEEGAPRWSRDGRWIYFVADRRDRPWFGPDDANLYAVPADLAKPTDGAALRTVIDIAGPVGAFAEATDGRIATVGHFATDPPRSYDQEDLLLTDGAWSRRAVRNLTATFDFDIADGIASDQHPPRGGGGAPLAWSGDGRALFATVGRHGAAMLARIDAASGEVTELTDTGHAVIGASGTPDGQRWALTLGDPTRPGVLYRFDAASRALTKLWDPNQTLFAGLSLGTVEEFWYTSFDGTRIQAWIVKPPGFSPARKYPAVLEIHGGPHAAYGVGFFHEFQHLAGAGYVVLYTNPRGSTTYGQAFGNSIQYHYPGDDVRDLMLGVDSLLARGYVDPARLGVTGGSGGGLLTNWIIGHTRRFAAAVTERCVSDWTSFWYSADFTLFTPTWFRKPPFEDPEDYRERSPVTYAARIETPLMIVDGEEDWRTPIGQSEAMFRALTQQRKPTVMVRFPGESHELTRSGLPSHRVQNQHHVRSWFDKYLLGKQVREYDEVPDETRRAAP